MFRDYSKLSVRAATWIGAKCLKVYCIKHDIEDRGISEFCTYLESLASAKNIPEWDEAGNNLEIIGLGDPMPKQLERDKDLVEIITCVREISASQIYGAWVPSYTNEYLGKALKISKLNLSKKDLEVFLQHDANPCGWGGPLTDSLLENWKIIA